MTCPVVYELWADNDPLYVGVTNRFYRRLSEHRTHSPGMVTRTTKVRLTFFADRRRAESYEDERIAELRPRWNRRGNPDRRPVEDWTEWDAYLRDEYQEGLDLLFGAALAAPA